MAKKEKKDLKQSKSLFKFVGKATRLDKDGAYNESVMTRGNREGQTFRSLRFGVKTSESNTMTVQMFDFEPTEVFLWNSEKKKADANYKGDRVPFEQWQEEEEELKEQGFTVMQARVGFDYDSKGKLISKGVPSYVASELIYDNLTNGDLVAVEGEIRYSTYTNREGVEVEQKNYTIKKVHRIKELDFEAEDFEEVTYFEQDIVYVDAFAEKKNNRAIIVGRVIDFKGDFHDTQFVVNYSDGDGGIDKDMVELADNLLKMFKFGDTLTIFGNAVNRAIVEEVEEVVDKKLKSLGGKSKPKHTERFTATSYISEMQIEGVETYEHKVYTEEDFIKDELIVKDEEKESIGAKLGGKSKKKDNNPFESDGDLEEIDEDALPF